MARGSDANRTVLTPEVIRAALARLAEVLADADVSASITIYGGASLALADFENDRTATADVDGTYHPVEAVEHAARRVGEELGLADGWLNNRMQMFVPPTGSTTASCSSIVATFRSGSARPDRCWP